MLAVLLLVVVDVLLAPRPAGWRSPAAGRPVRQGETTVDGAGRANRGDRRVRGLLRDAWQPSAGATGNRHRLDLAAGDQVLLTHPADARPGAATGAPTG